MAPSMWNAINPNSSTVRQLITAARNRELYDVDWDSDEGSWGVINSRGVFIQHTHSREAARVAARHRDAREGL
ncbi:hypothetical protein [Streptomyces melanosporofaciens]|uniref:Uncharacterized protein n=1 Tax=Streptomyces melanosporofaciens TaxID=67327 RepID=A0A1H4KPS3_STRMJ|nr:hypothetical protein [Streptomyces melanosporofaciens]SEB60497.1 hypothetical protein SAMN04490356_0890 [Streptomyces melanosporofaciens]